MSTPQTPNMQTIALIGVGLMGGSLGLAFKRLGIGGRIVGISRKETVDKALRLGALDEGVSYDQLPDVLRTSDAAFLCTPIHRILELLPKISKSAKQGAIVTDVGSTKVGIVALAERIFPSDVHFIGGHPMAGSESRGVQAADPFLFQNAIYVLTPSRGTPQEAVERLMNLVERLGARVAVMDASAHDRIAAAVSHLPQMMAVALMGMVGKLSEENPLFLRMAAGGFRDMTRIASSPYEIWKDICRTNAGPIATAIDAYIDGLKAVKTRISDEALGEDFRFANVTRGIIPRDSKGFLRPLYDVLVVVEDRPGMIAEISVPLAEAEVNIKDIEVLKVREDEGGTLRLAFGTEEEARMAVGILEGKGFKARVR
ncbi:MAG: prephenate dehydrogenase [Candidatus Latescibacteria bacterium]|nr:prephenate dehydrogenase [Candidatus Latescibacterota bacterium]